MSPHTVISEIDDLFAEHGGNRYSEVVTQLEHTLQCAQLAEDADSEPALIVAALLHDIGHILHRFGAEPAAQGIDDHHEAIGAGWLTRAFPPMVTEPVRLHVDAKRYLCSVDPEYFATLSPASVRSLELQGGPMGAVEAESFEENPYFEAAVRLRRWDEAGKVEGQRTLSFEHFTDYFHSVLAE